MRSLIHRATPPRARALLPGILLALAPALGGCPITGPKDTPLASCSPPTLTVGGSVAGNTGEGRCKGTDGQTGNFFALVLTEQAAVKLTLAGNSFPGYLGFYTSDGTLIYQKAAPDALTIPIVLPAGKYLLRVDSKSGADGPFTVSAAPMATSGCGDGERFVLRGVTINGAVTSNSCIPGGVLRQEWWILLGWKPGESVSVTTTVDKPTYEEMRGGDGNPVLTSKNFGPGTWTATVPLAALSYGNGSYYMTGLWLFAMSSANLPITYSLKVE